MLWNKFRNTRLSHLGGVAYTDLSRNPALRMKVSYLPNASPGHNSLLGRSTSDLCCSDMNTMNRHRRQDCIPIAINVQIILVTFNRRNHWPTFRNTHQLVRAIQIYTPSLSSSLLLITVKVTLLQNHFLHRLGFPLPLSILTMRSH